MPSLRSPIDVLVFDSGLGGLSIVRELRRSMPHLRYAYLADNAGLPYGNKSDEWLVARVDRVIASVLVRLHPRLIVIACNTASTLVLETLRAKNPMPIVGVVPAIKPAATLSQSKIIGLLATPATVKRPYTESLIQEFAGGCQVISVGNARLVEVAEKKLRGIPPDIAEMKAICLPFIKAPQLDVLVLGCTHFPLLADELQTILPRVKLLDSGPAIAQRVQHVLPLTPEHESKTSNAPAFFTADAEPDDLRSVLPLFGFNSLTILPLDS